MLYLTVLIIRRSKSIRNDQELLGALLLNFPAEMMSKDVLFP